ncbi:MAG: D-alanine--D-alanine ligase family protein [Candidatus Rokuibacteriota bacterium]
MSRLLIGLAYDLFGSYPARPGDPPDAEVEYEPEATVLALEGALRRLGLGTVRLGNPHAVLRAVGQGTLPRVDAVLTIAEGYGPRSREAWVPVLCEMAGIPTLGSDALTLSTTLDKVWAHRIVAGAGVPIPAHTSLASSEEAAAAPLPAPFPLFVKPRWEGTAKGIGPSSRVEGREALVTEVARVVRTYRQPALVEAFLDGPEYTVTLVGHRPPRALPTLQRALEASTRIGAHALLRHPAPPGGWRHVTPGELDGGLESELTSLARRAFDALECRDFARADFRLDGNGRPHFLEMNPLPTFAPDGSFGIIAELLGRPLDDLLAEILGEALVRLGL